jgi:class 3 adenylate cyclase/streptogramin lyase
VPERPIGTVTFLFTDIEGSTRLLQQLRAQYDAVQSRHAEILRAAFAAHDGHEIDTQGDAFFAAFGRARDAVAAAVDGQRALAAEQWPDGAVVRVRMGLHTGEPLVGGERYVGMGVNRGARICAAGHGGQVLLSNTTRELVEDDLPDDVRVVDLGERQLKDLPRPERIFQLEIDGLPSTFPPLRAGDAPTLVEGREQELTRAAAVALPSRLTRRWALLGVAFALAAAAVVTAFVLTRPNASHSALQTLREVPPDSVGVIDAKSNRLVDAVSIGGRISGIAYGAGSIWVGDYDGQTLIRIDPSTAKITDTVALPGRPTEIVFAAGRVWVSSASAGMLIRIDPRYETIDRRIHLHQAIYNQGLRSEYAPMAAGRHGLWVGHDISALTRIDPVRATPVKQLILDAPVVGLAEGANDVWAVTGGEGRLVAVNPFSNTIEGSIPAAGANGAAAVGPEAVWMDSNATNEVWRIDPVTRSPAAIIHVDGGLSGIAVGAGGVWIARLVGSVSRIDPRTNRVVTTIHVGDSPQELTIVGDRIWVTVSNPIFGP